MSADATKWTSINCLVHNMSALAPSVLYDMAYDALSTVQDLDATQEDAITAKCRLIVAALLVEQCNNGLDAFGKALHGMWCNEQNAMLERHNCETRQTTERVSKAINKDCVPANWLAKAKDCGIATD